MRACHALEHALLQCTEALAVGGALTLTVKCAPQVPMGRIRGVCMTKLKMRKAGLHNEVHLSYLQLALAAAMPPSPLRPTIGPSRYRVPQAHPNSWLCVTCRFDEPL